MTGQWGNSSKFLSKVILNPKPAKREDKIKIFATCKDPDVLLEKKKNHLRIYSRKANKQEETCINNQRPAKVIYSEQAKVIYSELTNESATITCVWQTHTSRGLGKLYSGKKEGFRYTLIGSCWHGEAAGSLTRSRASYVVGWGSIQF